MSRCIDRPYHLAIAVESVDGSGFRWLAKPVSRQGNYLVCQACQRHYPIRDGIPVMLIDEALTREQAEANAS